MKKPNTPSADAKLIAMAILTAMNIYNTGLDDEDSVDTAAATLQEILKLGFSTSDKPDEVDNDEADLKHCHGC